MSGKATRGPRSMLRASALLSFVDSGGCVVGWSCGVENGCSTEVFRSLEHLALTAAADRNTNLPPTPPQRFSKMEFRNVGLCTHAIQLNPTSHDQ